MRKVRLIWIGFILLKATSVSGQCLESDSLWNRIISLAVSRTISTPDELKALLNYEISFVNCPNRNDSSHAFLLRRIGSVYFKLGDYLKAVEYCQRSIRMIKSNAGNPAIRIREIITNYYWLSVFYDGLNNVDGKLKAWDSCESYAIKLKAEGEISYIRVLYSRVERSFDIGDYQNCIYYAGRCRALASRYANSVTNKGFIGAGSGLAESSLGWNVKALLILKNYDSAEKMLANKVSDYKRANLKGYLGFAYALSAEVQEHKGNYQEALAFFNRALLCYRQTGDHFLYKQILKQIGEEVYFMHFNDGDKALGYFREALSNLNRDQSEYKEDIVESLSILGDIANVYVRKNMYDSAFAYFQLAYDQIKHGISEADFLQTVPGKMKEFKKIHYLIRLIIDKADAYKEEYKTTGQNNALLEAIRIYKNADQLLDQVKWEQSDLNSKLFWRSDTRRLYEHAIEASYENGNNADAFYFFERSRASLLNDQLNEQAWLDEDDISRLTQIRKRILQLDLELSNPKSPRSRQEEILTERFNKKKELDVLEQLIKSKNPLYYQSFLDKTEFSTQDVQKNVLKDHQAILELFTGDSADFSLVITHQEIHVSKIDKAGFDSLLNRFMAYLSDPVLLNKEFNEFTAASHHLYLLLFHNNPLPAGRIIFSPGGRYFPLEALVTGNGTDQPAYFQTDHAVSYTYSIRYLLNEFKKNGDGGTYDFMGVAPVQYRTPAFSFPELAGSDQSLQIISSLFLRENNLIGNMASKNNFLKQFSKYRIIQIYTHSSDSSLKGEPVMYFADSALYLSELIPQNKPVTQLIVLSACETGSGREYKGEGIFSFNRGFAALGIPAAITNLWAVEDKATYRLMQIFYKYLSDGLPTDLALQKAKLEFVQTGSATQKLPYYWAAAILVGKTDAIHPGKAIPWKMFAFIVIFAGTFFFLIRGILLRTGKTSRFYRKSKY